jgi:hypothetical protein
MRIKIDMCEKGKRYTEKELKGIPKGESVLMEYPYRRSNNNFELYSGPETVEVTWLGEHSTVGRSSLKFYKVQHKSGITSEIHPGHEFTFYHCEAGDPMPLEGGRRRRMRRKSKRAKKHLRRSHRRLKSLN